MIREIHFYESWHDMIYNSTYAKDTFVYFDMYGTKQAIKSDNKIIYTTQMSLLSTELFTKGFKVFVHNYRKSAIEIKLGENNWTDRNITIKNNLFNLWLAGEINID